MPHLQVISWMTVHYIGGVLENSRRDDATPGVQQLIRGINQHIFMADPVSMSDILIRVTVPVITNVALWHCDSTYSSTTRSRCTTSPS
jgi:hypothetical protein